MSSKQKEKHAVALIGCWLSTLLDQERIRPSRFHLYQPATLVPPLSVMGKEPTELLKMLKTSKERERGSPLRN